MQKLENKGKLGKQLEIGPNKKLENRVIEEMQ